MGRAGPGLFDSDSFWDAASDLIPLVGVDLANAGILDFYAGDGDEVDEDDPIVLSIEDTAAHLNDGNFRRAFEVLKNRNNYSMLIILVVLSMKVGANIEPKYVRYIKSVYLYAETWENLPECREQIRVACVEYTSGQPYTFKDFDFGDDWTHMSDFGEAVEMMKVGSDVPLDPIQHALTCSCRPKNYHEPVLIRECCNSCKAGETEKGVLKRPRAPDDSTETDCVKRMKLATE